MVGPEPGDQARLADQETGPVFVLAYDEGGFVFYEEKGQLILRKPERAGRSGKNGDRLAEPGGIYTCPASHGEGRFVANAGWIRRLQENGQIATRYCTPEGEISTDEYWNINGSYFNIEGITSPDGRVFGKMAHAERRGEGVALNITGEQDMKIFEAGVRYFTV